MWFLKRIIYKKLFIKELKNSIYFNKIKVNGIEKKIKLNVWNRLRNREYWTLLTIIISKKKDKITKIRSKRKELKKNIKSAL